MIARSAIIAAVFCANMLAGCDTIHGIQRSANFEQPVDWACVQTAVEAAHPGAEITLRENESTGFGLTPKWGPYVDQTRYLSYSVTDVPYVVIQSTKKDGEATLFWSQYVIAINKAVEKPVIEKARIAMLATETAASERCGLNFSGVKERVS